MTILVVNAGSSTYKLSLFSKDPVKLLWKDTVEFQEPKTELILEVLERAREFGLDHISVIGHRVVHGGRKFVKPTLITQEVKEAIRHLIPLAPLHNPENLKGIEMMESLFPNVKQVAVFDTAFHATMPEVAKTYAIPLEWKDKGVQRYGFHGISHEYCAQRSSELLKKNLDEIKIVTCHLGNGCSLAAIKNGMSVETTMGMTPMEGLMMGTRSGSIDPGILIFLEREHGFDADSLDHLLNFESGLKGISEKSGDMRDILHEIEIGDTKAHLAFEMFVYIFKKQLGEMIAVLGGIDALVFAGGIGENSDEVRKRCCEGLNYLGLRVEENKNRSIEFDGVISEKGSKVSVLVVHTKEDLMIARSVADF